MNCYLHIKPTFDCIVKISKEEYILNAQKTYSFIVKEQTLTLLFYPINTDFSSLPFATIFDIQNPKSTKNAQIIEFPNSNYLLVVTPFLIGSNTNLGVKTKTVTLNNQSHTIYYLLHSNFNIKIECNSCSEEYYLNAEVEDFNTKTHKNNLLIYCKCKDSKHIVLALTFDGERYNYKNLEVVDMLEEEKGNISTYKNLNDFAGHGVVTNYDLTKDICMTSTLVYNTTPFLSHKKELIPYAFFEAVKVKNYKLANSYLAQNLTKILTPSHYQKFFGDFTQILPPLYKTANYNQVALVYNSKNKSIAKNFSLQFNEYNKITNIEEV